MIQNDLQRPALTGIENQIESFGIESRIGERRNRVGRSWISSQPVELAHLIVPDLLEVGVIDTAAPRPYLDQIRGIILAECFEQARTATLPIGLEEIGLGLDIAIKISPPCSPSFVRQFVPLITGRNVLFLTETLPSAEYPLSLSGALHRRLFLAILPVALLQLWPSSDRNDWRVVATDRLLVILALAFATSTDFAEKGFMVLTLVLLAWRIAIRPAPRG